MASSFDGVQLAVPVELGNMILWLCLEVLVLGMVVLWTANVARVIVYRRIKNALPVRMRHRRGFIDWLPMNADLRPLQRYPKLFLTFIRLAVAILVAVTGIGIDPARVYVQYRRSEQAVVRNDANFTGRAFNPSETVSVADAAVAGCEEVDTTALRKYRAFIAGSSFSCNSGNRVEQREIAAEVIWNPRTLEEILKGTVLPVNVKLGENSFIDREHSNTTFVRISRTHVDEPWMHVVRRGTSGTQIDGYPGEREFLVFSREGVEPLNRFTVGAAYVMHSSGEQGLLRNTDRMVWRPEPGSNRRIHLARRVAGTLVSIIPETNSRVYYGHQRKVTVIYKGFGILMVLLVVINSSMFLVTFLLRLHFSRGVHVDVFSAPSMYSLAMSNLSPDVLNNSPNDTDIILGATRNGSGWDIGPVEHDDVLVSLRAGRIYSPERRKNASGT